MMANEDTGGATGTALSTWGSDSWEGRLHAVLLIAAPATSATARFGPGPDCQTPP